jgi:hypothetical protein
MGFKLMLLFKDGERKGNAQVFATESEARASAKSLFMRWIQLKPKVAKNLFTEEGFDTEETNDPVNYRHVDGVDHRL